jgi:hypothetical protein
VYTPLPTDDPRQRLPDIELARTRLDWQPSTPLEAGLSQTIVSFSQALKSAINRAINGWFAFCTIPVKVEDFSIISGNLSPKEVISQLLFRFITEPQR